MLQKVQEHNFGGIPVLDIRPRGWTETNRVAVFTHGRAHTLYSAQTLLGTAAMFADDTGLRVISLDYTLAPA